MLELGHQAGIGQHPHGPQFVEGDDDCSVGLAIADVGHQAVVTCIRGPHHTGGAVDGDRRPIGGFVVGEVHVGEYAHRL